MILKADEMLDDPDKELHVYDHDCGYELNIRKALKGSGPFTLKEVETQAFVWLNRQTATQLRNSLTAWLENPETDR